jgi:hypothetical protein
MNIQSDRSGRNGKVSSTSGKLLHRGVRGWFGETQLYDHLVGLKGSHKEAVEEVGRWDHTFTFGSNRHDLGIQQHREHAPFRRRVRVSDTAAECAQGANRIVTNPASRAFEHREALK